MRSVSDFEVTIQATLRRELVQDATYPGTEDSSPAEW